MGKIVAIPRTRAMKCGGVPLLGPVAPLMRGMRIALVQNGARLESAGRAEAQGDRMIIDFRVRPPTQAYRESGAYEVWLDPASRYRIQWEGREPVPSMLSGCMHTFVQEMDEAGINLSVLVGRVSQNARVGRGNVPARELADLMARYPGRFAGLAAVDPLDPQVERHIAEAKAMGLCGICLEPFWSSECLYLDDARLFPLYRLLEREALLFTTTLNYNCGQNTSWNNPMHIERIALACPELPILVVHACWPRVTELMAIAVRYPNIHLIPDCYHYFPFINTRSEQQLMYNHLLQNQVLFASSYPIRGFAQAVRHAAEGPWLPEPREKFFWKNAARLLRLEFEGFCSSSTPQAKFGTAAPKTMSSVRP